MKPKIYGIENHRQDSVRSSFEDIQGLGSMEDGACIDAIPAVLMAYECRSQFLSFDIPGKST